MTYLLQIEKGRNALVELKIFWKRKFFSSLKKKGRKNNWTGAKFFLTWNMKKRLFICHFDLFLAHIQIYYMYFVLLLTSQRSKEMYSFFSFKTTFISFIFCLKYLNILKED